jgi:hypothetical protein
MLLLGFFQTIFLIVSVALLAFHLLLLIRIRRSNKDKKPSIPKRKTPKSLPKELRTETQVHREESVRKAEPTEGAKPPKRRAPAYAPATAKQTRNTGCPYHFGYMKKHPKDTPIPNACLTCNRIIECSLGVDTRLHQLEKTEKSASKSYGTS